MTVGKLITTLVFMATLVNFDFTHGVETLSNRKPESKRNLRSISRQNLGVSFNIFRPRIVGGSQAYSGEFPSFSFTSGTTLCGGTLIHDDIILTAAHCNSSFAPGALVGGIFLNGTGSEFIAVKQSIPHPSYDQSTQDNDIMLIKLNGKSNAAKQALNIDATVPSSGTTVKVIGYGHTTYQGTTSNELLKVTVDATTDVECSAFWGSTYNPAIKLCAGIPAGGKDSCQGDSGGPLMTTLNVQVGIVSSGVQCANPNSPALYTRVSAYDQWIRSTICNVSDFPPPSCSQTTLTGAPQGPSATKVPTTKATPKGTLAPIKAPVTSTFPPSVPKVIIPALTQPTGTKTMKDSKKLKTATAPVPVKVAPVPAPALVTNKKTKSRGQP